MQHGIDNNECMIAVSWLPDSENMFVLGDTFIRNFYSIFNYEENKVGLAQSVYAPKGTSIETLVESEIVPH